jgi:hypothetical protein
VPLRVPVPSHGVESIATICRGLGQSLYMPRSGSSSNLYRLEVASHSKAKSHPLQLLVTAVLDARSMSPGGFTCVCLRRTLFRRTLLGWKCAELAYSRFPRVSVILRALASTDNDRVLRDHKVDSYRISRSQTF